MAVQTQIQVRRGTASSWTSTNPTLAAGEIGFESDTGKFKIGTGSSTWNALAYTANGGIPESLIDAKGDLIVGSAADTAARLAVGSNGQTFVADSSQTTGLGWANNFAAGKNKIINGDFSVNQRGFTSTTTSGTYGLDRWVFSTIDGTCTYSAESFTAGNVISGYEPKTFARIVTTGQTLASAETSLRQPIEDVRTLAGQTVTFSFWAKAASGSPKVAVQIRQNFGTGGSPSSLAVTYIGQVTLTTSWARYSVTGTMPSVSGKTIGTTTSGFSALALFVSAGSDSAANTGSIGIQSNTFDFWGVQVEAGSVATAFQTATGTIQGELAACQRYYWRSTQGGTYSSYALGTAGSTTIGFIPMPNPVPMRVNPTSIDYANLELADLTGNSFQISSLAISYAGVYNSTIAATTAGVLVVARPYMLRNNNNTAGYLGFSAEL